MGTRRAPTSCWQLSSEGLGPAGGHSSPQPPVTPHFHVDQSSRSRYTEKRAKNPIYRIGSRLWGERRVGQGRDIWGPERVSVSNFWAGSRDRGEGDPSRVEVG